MASLTSYGVSINRLVSKVQQGLFSASFGDAEMTAFEHDVFKQSWMMTISLCVNVRVYYNLLAKDTDLNPGYRS